MITETKPGQDSGAAAISGEAVRQLEARLHGSVVVPGDPTYDTARSIFSAAFDRRPSLIVKCAVVSDVTAAVAFAREHDLEIAVRSGGHSVNGYSTTNGGLVIDLSLMKGMSIYPSQRRAWIEPGLTWSEVAAMAQPYGLALTSGNAGSVGVGGLLLGGGMGWMIRKYGLTIDRLRAVELVTADGRFLRASADQHADLFWGLRGGGGNFGIATAFEVDLHPVGTVLSGAVIYDARHAERLVPAYAHLAAAAPDELTTQGTLTCAPPLPFVPPDLVGKPVFAVMVCYTGDIALGERVIEPLRHLETPILDLITPMPYPAVLTMFEGDSKSHMAHDGCTLFLQSVDDRALQTYVEEALVFMAPGMMAQVAVLGGAMSRVAPDATAFAHRDAQMGFRMMLDSDHIAPLQASMEHIWQAVRSYGKGVYANLMKEEGQAGVHMAYPDATYARLARVKQHYDPTNVFHLNQNILPSHQEVKKQVGVG